MLTKENLLLQNTLDLTLVDCQTEIKSINKLTLSSLNQNNKPIIGIWRLLLNICLLKLLKCENVLLLSHLLYNRKLILILDRS